DDLENNPTPSAASRTIAMIKVADSIYMLKGKGGNIGVSYGDDGVLMVDSQFAPASGEIKNLVASLTTKPIQFLVNTHHHGDHTGGNENMINSGTTVIAHDNARYRLVQKERAKVEKAQGEEFQAMVDKLKSDGDNEKAEAKAKEGFQGASAFDPSKYKFPAITFSKDMTFHYNGETIMVIHVHNAHTDGDAIVYFTESNVLHTGDTFFNGRYPYIDLNSGGSYDGYMNALSSMLRLIDDETRIIPGHGDVGSKADMKRTLDMMKALRDRVSFHYLNKKSKEEILADKEITREYDQRGYGDFYISTEKFVGMLYDLAKAKYGAVN
ncbi:MAG: MBL fold metallo-hydrolase, partial [Bacteroidota bacterium]